MKFMDFINEKRKALGIPRKKLLQDMAPIVGCNAQHLISIAYEKRKPSYPLARKIWMATSGAVLVEEMIEIVIEKKYMCPCCHHKITRAQNDKIVSAEWKAVAGNDE
jgi:DNA-binding XRE family transcriptional regulator